MSTERSAIVIGGGVIGCATSYYLANLGWNVRLLDRHAIGSGASSGNCGFVCPSHALPLSGPGALGRTLRMMLRRDSPIAIRLQANPSLWYWLLCFAQQCRRAPMMRSARGRHALLKSSLLLYRELLANKSIDCNWQDKGLLNVYKSAREFDSFANVASMIHETFGIVATPHTGRELARLEPALRSDLAGAWLFPGDAHVRPEQLLSSLRRALDAKGVVIEEGVDVRAMTVRGDQLRRVETSRGVMSADAYVLAIGAEAPKFAKSLGCRIPIQPGKGYSLMVRGMARQPQIPMIFEEHHVAVTPFVDGMRIGSTMEFTGYDSGINEGRLALLMKSTRQHLNDVPESTTSDEWFGWRPMVYDGLPCVDQAPAARNVVVAAGNGMIGLSTAPATGKLAAELVTGAPPHIDPSPYSLGRF